MTCICDVDNVVYLPFHAISILAFLGVKVLSHFLPGQYHGVIVSHIPLQHHAAFFVGWIHLFYYLQVVEL